MRNNYINGYLRLPDVLKVFPVSKSTWWAGIKDGKYPKPVKLSTRVSAWKTEDIYALVADASCCGNAAKYSHQGVVSSDANDRPDLATLTSLELELLNLLCSLQLDLLHNPALCGAIELQRSIMKTNQIIEANQGRIKVMPNTRRNDEK